VQGKPAEAQVWKDKLEASQSAAAAETKLPRCGSLVRVLALLIGAEAMLRKRCVGFSSRCRRKHREKRGGGAEHCDVDETRLAAEEPRKAELGETKVLCGATAYLGRRASRVYPSSRQSGTGLTRGRGSSMRSRAHEIANRLQRFALNDPGQCGVRLINTLSG
jgi:hypothetical protein